MLFIRTVIGMAHTLGKLLRGEQAVSFHHSALAVQPLRLNRVEPWAFGGEIAHQYPHSVTSSFMLHLVVMFLDPLLNLTASVPGRIVPHHHQYPLASLPQLTAAPFQVAGRHAAYRTTIYETQQHFSHVFVRQPQPVTSQCLGVWIAFGHFLLNQAQRLLILGPTMHRRMGYSAPPHFILKAECPIRVRCRQPHQPVSTLFFRAYCGSGEAIHSLALSRRTPKITLRFISNVARTVSPDTCSFVSPISKLTSAASSNVQIRKFYGAKSLPRSRGLRCSSPRRAWAPSSVKARSIVWGREEPLCRQASPRSLKAWMALRTVWSSQQSVAAICGARWP